MNSNSYVGKLREKAYNALRTRQLKRREYPIELSKEGERTGFRRMPLDEAFERITRLHETDFREVHFVPTNEQGIAADERFYGAAVDYLRRNPNRLLLINADISGLVFDNFPFDGVLAKGVRATGTQMEGPLKYANFKGALLYGAKIVGPKMNVNFQGARINEKTDLSGTLDDVFLPQNTLLQLGVKGEDALMPVCGKLERSNGMYHLERTVVPLHPLDLPSYKEAIRAKVS